MKLFACGVFLAVCSHVAWAQCSADEMDLCDASTSGSGSGESDVSAAPRVAPCTTPLVLALALVLPVGGAKQAGVALALVSLAYVLPGASAADAPHYHPQSTCGDLKEIYRENDCCGNPDTVTNYSVAPMPRSSTLVSGDNPCEGAKPTDWTDLGDDGTNYFLNAPCSGTLEQSGTNVTAGYSGEFNTSGELLGSFRGPIRSHYWEAGLCPVNVHWHLGAEHLSVGQYDENGAAPHFTLNDTYQAPGQHEHEGDRRLRRRLAGGRVRKGFSCHHYVSDDPMFTREYDWKHCRDTHVGETYEIHWPHSAAGDCGTPWQYQSPFYDGVFCNAGEDGHSRILPSPLNTFEKVGVQAQVFTIVNDERYYYPDLIRGMIVNGAYGEDLAYYTGSTTGTTRDNELCSKYTPITWQVDRKCHLISASSFDKMCRDMLAQKDDMSNDVKPTGARVLVDDAYAADQDQR